MQARANEGGETGTRKGVSETKQIFCSFMYYSREGNGVGNAIIISSKKTTLSALGIVEIEKIIQEKNKFDGVILLNAFKLKRR